MSECINPPARLDDRFGLALGANEPGHRKSMRPRFHGGQRAGRFVKACLPTGVSPSKRYA